MVFAGVILCTVTLIGCVGEMSNSHEQLMINVLFLIFNVVFLIYLASFGVAKNEELTALVGLRPDLKIERSFARYKKNPSLSNLATIKVSPQSPHLI